MTNDDRVDPVVFAERTLALLDTGSFTMSYKYAVLLGLVDCCLEQLSETGQPPATVRASAVADKVLELYWRQATPFPRGNVPRVLSQRPERRKLDLVARIAEFRQHVRFELPLHRARHADPRAFDALRDRVYVTVVRMPLPKLQRMNADDPFGDGFMYRIGWPDQVSAARVRRPDFDDRIHFKPGVAEALLRVSGIIRPIVQRQWAAFVARRNADVLDDLMLDEFLFDAERVSLDRVRAPLVELQHGGCFYCQQPLRRRTDVDHFLPWSRSTDDGLDNLVAAHAGCNNAKRASLAAGVHLQRWLERGEHHAASLASIADATPWPRDARRTHAVARALYLYQAPGTSLWLAPDAYDRADAGELQRLLLPSGAHALAADEPPDYVVTREP